MKKLFLILILALFGCNGSPQTQQFWRDFNNNYQRQLDREAYGYRPVFSPGPRSNPSSNYWQERTAKQQALEYWRKQQGVYGY